MPNEVMSLIREVYRQAALREMPAPFVTRLVKILYLADIEWRRRHDGEPVSNLTWKYLHFGPYALELAGPLGGPDIELEEFKGGRVAKRFNLAEEELRKSDLPDEVSLIIRNLVEKWGDVDLNILLDHVYFDTEPMQSAKRGELLDFSKLTALDQPIKPSFNEAKLKALRAKLHNKIKELNFTREGLRVPVIDIESARAWDEDDKEIKLPQGGKIDIWS